MRDPVSGASRALEIRIHPTAQVDATAALGPGVEIGPWTIVGPNVRIGARTTVGSHVLIERDTTVGEECRIHKGAVLGSDPQDLKYLGEQTFLEVGDRTVIREYATLNRGTVEEGVTTVGSDCLLMAYTHVAHDCHLGNHVILSNAVNMAGHVTIGDWAIVGGMTPIHQFVRIGEHAFVGGASRCSHDVPPYTRMSGNPGQLFGLNSVGLQRRGFSEEVRTALKKAYRILFRSKEGTLAENVVRAREEVEQFPEVVNLIEFLESSERGLIS
jgi:UDP-N-acetylglucosamine acyltransferase